MWPFNSKGPPCRSVVFVDSPTPEKLKAPDLSPAVPPKDHVFFVEPIVRYSKNADNRPDVPFPHYVRVYLFTNEQARYYYPPSKSNYDYPAYSVGYTTAYWSYKDPEETKKWINSAMHDLLKLKRKKDEEKARIEALTGFYPPKEM